MRDKKPSRSILPDGDDDFHMADTDELETLGEADTDVLETLKDADNSEGDRGFDPYNNTRPRSKTTRSRG
jgi:hypothetical protein